MPVEMPEIGTLFIAHEVLQVDKWMLNQVVTAAMQQIRKYRGFDGYLRSSRVRVGDFALTLGLDKPSPYIVNFIGIPGLGKNPIIQELYVKS